jgi:hypothetical protein
MKCSRRIVIVIGCLSALMILDSRATEQTAVGAGKSPSAGSTPAAPGDFRGRFLELCDLAVDELNKEITVYIEKRHRKGEDPRTHHIPFFEDSYAIRALCVAYDMTGDKKYLDACTRWSDHVVACQQRMIPKGAYFPNYDFCRQPGQDKGGWYVADSGSIAAGVLATAVRTTNPHKRQLYLASIRSFARLVIDNYVHKDGGITDGLWSYTGEWWASTAIFGELMFLAYAEMHDPEYLKVGLGAADWLNRHDFHKDEKPAFEAMYPCMVFYCFEFYATALPYLEPGTARRQAAEAHIAEGFQWMAQNQKGRGAKSKWNYRLDGTYMAGNPYLMCVFARHLPQYADQVAEGDKELRYVTGVLYENGKKPRVTNLEIWTVMIWTMTSYAERLSPGALFRTSHEVVPRLGEATLPAVPSEFRGCFRELCDLTVGELNKKITPYIEKRDRTGEDPKTHHMPFFEDSFGVRALCVACDMTGNQKYLDACTRWADYVVACQQRMTPKGAYYTNYDYARQPGQDKGGWYVADSGSIGMGVLAVAVRTTDHRKKQLYLDSIRSFARLVIDNYVRKSGGVTDGLWTYPDEWWCSTATFGALMFLAYDETKDPEYLRVALGAADWLSRHDFHKEEKPAFEALNPGMVFYCFEFYATALPHLKPGSPRRAAAEAHVAEAFQWLAENQKGRGAQSQWNYLDGSTYMSGNPYLMYVFARYLPQYGGQVAEGDKELRYETGLLYENGKKPRATKLQVWELMTWAMMSYAERLSPGALFRVSH